MILTILLFFMNISLVNSFTESKNMAQLKSQCFNDKCIIKDDFNASVREICSGSVVITLDPTRNLGGINCSNVGNHDGCAIIESLTDFAPTCIIKRYDIPKNGKCYNYKCHLPSTNKYHEVYKIKILPPSPPYSNINIEVTKIDIDLVLCLITLCLALICFVFDPKGFCQILCISICLGACRDNEDDDISGDSW